MEHATSLQLTNTRTTEVTLAIEPWGEHYVIPSDQTVAIAARGAEPGVLQVVLTDTIIQVWGWVGSVVEVLPQREESLS